jgi:hypothetical protein
MSVAWGRLQTALGCHLGRGARWGFLLNTEYFQISVGARGTSRNVAGSIPDEVIGFFNWPNPSSRTVALGLTQPQTELTDTMTFQNTDLFSWDTVIKSQIIIRNFPLHNWLLLKWCVIGLSHLPVGLQIASPTTYQHPFCSSWYVRLPEEHLLAHMFRNCQDVCVWNAFKLRNGCCYCKWRNVRFQQNCRWRTERKFKL